jgi:hypothetical protein
MFIFVRWKQIFVINNGDFFLLLVVIIGIRYRNLIPDTNLKGGFYSTSTAADLLAAMIYHCFAETHASWIQHYILSHWIFWVTRIQQNSSNPTFQFAWDQTSAELSNTLDYQTVQVLTGNYFLLLLYFGCTINQRNIPYGCLLHLLVQHHQSPLLCLHSLRSWCSMRQMDRRYYNSWYTGTLGGLFEHVAEICLCNW